MKESPLKFSGSGANDSTVRTRGIWLDDLLAVSVPITDWDDQ